MRESKEFYSSGEEVQKGVYQNLKTGAIVHIYKDDDCLPDEPDNKIMLYTILSLDPDSDIKS